MKDLYWRSERLIIDPLDRGLRKVTVWDRFASIVTDGEFLGLIVFCIIGLLLTLAVTLATAGFGGITETLQQLL